MRRYGKEPTRRWWRRLEREAIAAHESDQLSELQQLARRRVPCRILDENAENPAEVLGLLLGQHRLLMSAVLPAQRQELMARSSGSLQLTAAGRYGRLWWIDVTDGSTDTVLAVKRVRLTRDAGGTPFGAASVQGVSPLRNR